MCSNIAGLRNNFNELKYVIKCSKPDIVFLNETHLTELCETSDLKLKDYQTPINCLSHSKHTGGVSVFVHNKIRISNVNVINEQFAWYLSFESRVNNELTVFAGLYLSSDMSNKSCVMQSFENWIDSLQLVKPIVICGDFNVNMLGDSIFSRQLKQICDDNGFDLLTDTYTRVTEHSKTLIDLCYSNINRNNISCSVCTENQISDHSILKISVYGKSDQLPVKFRTISVWKNYSEVKLWNSLENSVASRPFIENGSVNVKMDWILDTISTATCQFKSNKIIKTTDDFFDCELENMRRKKNELYKIAQCSSSHIDSSHHWHEYRCFKNVYKQRIQTKRYDCNQRKLNRVHGDIKGTWKVLNSILCKDSGEITRIKAGDSEFDDDIDIANEFNKYFINSIVEINDSIPPIAYTNNLLPIHNLTFQFHCVSITDVKYCLRELKNNTDEYFLNPKVLLDAIFVIGLQLVETINDMFSRGEFPYALKKSTIVPIQKIAGSIEIGDHRPINTLPCIERLIESLAYAQFSKFINDHNLLNACQSGFRANHSCETAINDVLYDWKEALEGSKVVVAVFLDLKRAFETIDLNILMQKLASIGVRGNSIKWFDTYLQNRRQIVKIGEHKSVELNNTIGVPQGSILGPLLFILYISDLPLWLKYCIIKMFADDTLLYVIANSIEDATQKLNEDLELLFNKLCQYKLKLNVDKTKAMIITNKKYNVNNVNIVINGTNLKIEKQIKYLGVIIDDKLNFEPNINQICKKLGQKLNVFSRLRNDLNTDQKLNLYKSIVMPHFNYCASILFLSKNSDINRLQKIQNKFMRQILRVNRHSNKEFLLNTLKLMSVNQIIHYFTVIFIFKIVNGLTPNYLTDRIKFNYESNHMTLRNSNQIRVSNATKYCSQNSLFYKGVQLYNSLPNDIKNVDSLNKFKSKIYKYTTENF